MKEVKCLKKRTIFDFFELFDCSSCSYFKVDEEISIGYNSIYLYYLKKCDGIEYDIDFLFLTANKVKLFLKDAICYQDKITILMVENFKNSDLYLIEELLDFGNDIHILII